jgi:hypothetical protein
MAIRRRLIDNAFSSDLFTFKDNTFIAEASDLNGLNTMQKIYDDAEDIGFAIRSKSTGTVIKFYFSKVHHDPDGDVTHWSYLPTPDHCRQPEIAKLKVTIFND